MSDRRSLAPKVTIDIDRILELKAKGEAVDSIRRALGVNGPGIRKIYEVIAEARAMHDPRAGCKKQGYGRTNAGPRRMKTAKRASGEALPGWWFGAETVAVMRRGICSTDCVDVAVSVSCVPRRVVTQMVTSKPNRKTDVHRTFADALADHPTHRLAGRQDRAEESARAQTSPDES